MVTRAKILLHALILKQPRENFDCNYSICEHDCMDLGQISYITFIHFSPVLPEF